MSQTRSYPIPCPQCGAQGAAELHESVNVAEHPELREDLMADRLNRVRCHDCGFEFRVDKPLLYHDPAHRLLLWWMPAGREQPDRARDEVARMQERLAEALGGESVPELQLVYERSELIERIFLVEAGLDPRLIEYVKYIIYSNNAARIDPARKRLLFNAQDSTGDVLCFVVQDVESRKLNSVLQYHRDAYAGVKEMFDGARAEGLRELFPGPYYSARALAME